MDRLAAMRAFVGTVEHRSFAEAARALRLSRSAVSKRTADLSPRTIFAILHPEVSHAIEDEARWLRDLDASIADSLAEMRAGGGVDLDTACDAVLADLAADGRPA